MPKSLSSDDSADLGRQLCELDGIVLLGKLLYCGDDIVVLGEIRLGNVQQANDAGADTIVGVVCLVGLGAYSLGP